MSKKRKNLLRLLASGALLTTIVASCVHEPIVPPGNGTGGGNAGNGGTGGGQPCDPSVIYFEKQILPMLVSNCGMDGCHSTGSAEDGVIITSYNSVMNSGIVKPGNANNSDLVEVLLESDPGDRMPRPPAAPFSTEQINLIRTWINQGAQNIICNSGDCDTSNITYSGTIKPIIQTNCLGCHNSTSASAGVDLSTHVGTQSVALNGKLYGAISHTTGYKFMPPGGSKMSDCDIIKVKKWVDSGAPNN